MASYGEVLINIIGVYVAALANDNSYGTGQLLELVQSVEQELETDEDTLKAYGVNLRALNVIIGGKSTIEEASLNSAAKAIVMGITGTPSGIPPNEITETDIVGGGGGTPYFGLVVVYAADDGGAVARAFCKSKLANTPNWEVEQNSFRTGEIECNHVAANQATKRIVRELQYEDASDVPDLTAAGAFDTLMGSMFT